MMSGSEVRRAVAAVRGMIDTGRYMPGDELWPAELTVLLEVERDVVVAALRELAKSGITRKGGAYWVVSRRHPRMRGLSRHLGCWLWSDQDGGRTFVSTTRAGLVVAKLADEEGHVVGDRVSIVAKDAAPEAVSAIRRGQPRAIEQAARKARKRSGASWQGDIEVVPAPPRGPAVTWLNDTSRPGLWYLSWREGESAGELVIGEVTDAGREIALWRSVDGEPAGPARPVTGLDEMEILGWAGRLAAGAYRSLERLIGRLGTSNLLRLSRG